MIRQPHISENLFIQYRLSDDGAPHLPSGNVLLELCKSTMNKKNYLMAGILIERALAEKNFDDDTKKLLMVNLGNAHRSANRFKRAIYWNDKLLNIKTITPLERANTHILQCQLLQNMWRVDEAMLHLVSAKKIMDQDPAVKKEKQLAWQKQAMFSNLRKANYKTAWEYYEYRHATLLTYKAMKALPHHLPEKKIMKGEDLKDKILLVTMEQGYGDIIQFARFIPAIAKQCRSVVVEVYPPLYELFKATLEKDNISVVMWEVAQPIFDRWVLICSLPFVMGVDATTLSQQYKNPYLVLPPAMKKNLPSKNKKIGINWYSSLIGKDHETKSAKLQHLLPLFYKKGFDFFSLQWDGGVEIKKLGLQGIIYDLAPMIKDFFHTATWVSAMDKVITIDTAPAHLCGALGVKTALLLQKNCDWRWGDSGKKNLWYGNDMTCYRQPEHGDWAAAIDAMLGDM